ncbi:hypothetical protein B0H13DRAFT_2335362 [Mycena leptocephala]|nr:hypothetical protein B0H13DRAFT_2335362 [Mycena leptocephala]
MSRLIPSTIPQRLPLEVGISIPSEDLDIPLMFHAKAARLRCNRFYQGYSTNSFNPSPHEYDPRAHHQVPRQLVPGNEEIHLVAMLETLKLQQEHTAKLTLENAELKAELLRANAGQEPAGPVSTVPSRGALASRVKATRRKGRTAGRSHRQPPPPAAGDDSDGDSDEPAPTTPKIYLEPKNLTTEALKEAKKAVQRFVTKTFRDVCRVSPKTPWPHSREYRINEITGEAYLTPNLAADVSDVRNRRLFRLVGEQAFTAICGT